MISYKLIKKYYTRINYKLKFFLIAILAIFVIIQSRILKKEKTNNTINENTQNKIKIKSAKGNVSFEEILQYIYKPYGFELDSLSKNNIIPKLHLKEEQSCSQIYANWLDASKTDITPKNNPETLLYENYTLNGYSTMSKCLFNETYNNTESHIDNFVVTKKWSQGYIDEWVKGIMNGNFSIHPELQYSDSISLYYAIKYYATNYIKGMTGAVVGSLRPWVESICLANGASKIVTIDYQHIKIGHKDITFLDAFDLVKSREVYFDTFDFIASFSSIEHSGLGRYGDPIDPIGDIREMQKLRCILKPGGILFLGIPIGQDDVGYNCHRTYGRIRLPLMFSGFELLSVFFVKPEPIELKFDSFEFLHGGNPYRFMQFVFVLKK